MGNLINKEILKPASYRFIESVENSFISEIMINCMMHRWT